MHGALILEIAGVVLPILGVVRFCWLHEKRKERREAQRKVETLLHEHERETAWDSEWVAYRTTKVFIFPARSSATGH